MLWLISCLQITLSRSFALSCQCLKSCGKTFFGFYFNLFTIPRPKGSICPSLNPKAQKVLKSVQRFCMESTKPVSSSFHWSDFLGLDAYLHVPIFLSHKRYLHFSVGSLNNQFVALPLVCISGIHQVAGPSTSPAALSWHPHCWILKRPSVEGTVSMNAFWAKEESWASC